MTLLQDVYINSLGMFMPGEPVASADMEEYLGCVGGKPSRYKALVLRQNRIRTRHYALDRAGNQLFSNAEMAARAVHDALGKSEVSAGDITFLAAATTIGDVLVPGIASHVHAETGFKPIEIASFQSVCASALMAIKSAWLQVKAGEHTCAAVCGSEFSSRYFRPGFYEGTAAVNENGALSMNADFLRFTLSDGAGAMILENKPNARRLSLRINWIDIRSYADRFPTCMLAGGAWQGAQLRHWADFGSPAEAARAGALMLVQDFDVMKKMIPLWIAHYLDLVDAGKVTVDDVSWLCSHYSAHSLKEEAMELLRKTESMIPEEKWFSNLATRGNTGAASIFVLLEELCREGKLEKGMRILCQVPESGRAMSGFMMLEVA